MEDLILSPNGEVFDGEAQALDCDLVVGVDVGDWIAFLFEEPLAHVLMVAGFGPSVVVNVEGFLLGLSFLLCGWSLCFFSLCRLGLFHLLWPLKMKNLVLGLCLFSGPDAEIPDNSDILLEPVEILGDEVVVNLPVVAQDDISVMTCPDEITDLSEAVLVEVEEAEVVADGQVLVEKSVVFLDQVDSWLKEVFQQLLGNQDLLVEVDLIEAGQRALVCKLVSPVQVLRDAFFDLGGLFLADFRVDISLVLSPSSADQFLLLYLEVENSGRAYNLHPVLNFLRVQVDAIDHKWRCSTFRDQSVEMCDDFPERKFLSILRRNQLLLDRGHICLILDMLVPKLARDVFRSSGLSHTWCASDKEVLLVGLQLSFEGDIVLDLSALHDLEEVDGAVDALAELVMVRLHEVCKQLEVPRMTLKLVELLWFPREIGEDDLSSVEVLEHHIAKYLHLLRLSLALIGLSAEYGLDIEDIEQQSISLIHILPHYFPLLSLMHVRIDQLRQKFLADFTNDGVDMLLPRYGVETCLLLQSWHNGSFAIEVILAACEFSPLMLEMNDLEVEIGLQNGHLSWFWGELYQDVVFMLGVFADKIVGSDRSVNELISDVAEVVLVKCLEDHLAGSVEHDQLRVKLFSEGWIVGLCHNLGPSDHLVLPLHHLLLRRVLSLHENHSNLRLPLLHRSQQLHTSLHYQALLLMLVQGSLRGMNQVLQAMLERVLRGERGFLFGAEDEVPDRLVSKLHFYDIMPFNQSTISNRSET